MPYKLVIFDFDGTLANSFPFFLKVYQQLADKYRFEKLEITDLASLHAIDFTQLIRMQAVPLWKIALVGRDFKKWMFRDLADIALFDGIPQLLERLAARGTLLALVSSNSTKNVRGVLGPEIAGLFHYYECGVALFGKQAKFQRILRKSGVAPEQAGRGIGTPVIAHPGMAHVGNAVLHRFGNLQGIAEGTAGKRLHFHAAARERLELLREGIRADVGQGSARPCRRHLPAVGRTALCMRRLGRCCSGGSGRGQRACLQKVTLPHW
jgi:phosphoglycolate phosphatase